MIFHSIKEVSNSDPKNQRVFFAYTSMGFLVIGYIVVLYVYYTNFVRDILINNIKNY